MSHYFPERVSDNMKINDSNRINHIKYRVMLSGRHQGTRIEKLLSAQHVKINMTLMSAQEFSNKLLRIEVRPFTSERNWLSF